MVVQRLHPLLFARCITRALLGRSASSRFHLRLHQIHSPEGDRLPGLESSSQEVSSHAGTASMYLVPTLHRVSAAILRSWTPPDLSRWISAGTAGCAAEPI